MTEVVATSSPPVSNTDGENQVKSKHANVLDRSLEEQGGFLGQVWKKVEKRPTVVLIIINLCRAELGQ